MPIYEFKCLDCNEYIEILVMGATDAQVEMKCTKCGSEALERILSTSHFSTNSGHSGKRAAASESRTCSGGSCTSWNLPGHSR